MTDSLDDLLSSCSLASRSIRLLTAETKRRTVLLRACCSEYEVALDRLGVSAARLDDVRQDAQQEQEQHERDKEAAEAAAQEPVPPASSSLNGRHKASATPAISASFRGSSMGVAAEQGHGQGLESVDSYGLDESLRITESLEEILEQARSIRTSNSRQHVGTAGAGAAAGGATFSRERASSATATAAQRAATATPRRSTIGDRTKPEALPSTRSGGGRVGRAPGRHNSTTPRAHSVGKAAGAGPVSSASRRSESLRNSSTSRVGPNPSRSGPSGTGRSGSHVGALKSRLSSSQSSQTKLGRPGHPDKQEQKQGHEQEQEQEVTGSGAAATEVASNLKSGMWAEVARYEAARLRLSGKNRGSNGGGDDEAAKNSLQHLKAAEEVLLRGLDSDSAACCGSRYPQGQNGVLPDSQFLQWRELLLTQPQLASERDFHSHDHAVTGSTGGADPQCREDGKGDVAGRGGSRDWMGLDKLEKVTRLQRSLLMLLDEVEGRRELLAHEFQETKRNAATPTRGGSDGRRAEVVDDDTKRDGMDRALRVFEDWYCWNKVAHVTSLLRERLDAMEGGMALDSCTGVGFQGSLSKEAKKLVDNPLLAFGGERENPLLSLPDPHDDCACDGCGSDDHDSAWRCGWQQSSAAQALRGTACLGVVQELQTGAPSCWPYGSACERGHSAELFAQQLRTTSILAAETDVSRLVIPTLARELSQASKASRVRVQTRSPNETPQVTQVGVQQRVPHGVEEVTHARVTGRGGVLDANVACLRERVPKRSAPAGNGNGNRNGKSASFDVDDADKRQKEIWAPALAVLRAVDAVLSGGGRSRTSFVHRGDACAMDKV